MALSSQLTSQKQNHEVDQLEQTASRASRAHQTDGISGIVKVACLVILLWGLATARSFLEPLCIAALLAFLMAPLHRVLNRKLRLPDSLAVLVSAIVFLSPLVFLGYLLVRQGQSLVQDFPTLVASAKTQFDHLASHPLAAKLGFGAHPRLGDVFQRISSGLGQGLGMLVGGLSVILNMGSQAVLIFVFSILFLSSRVHLRRSSEQILRRNNSFDASGLVNQATTLIQKFLVARMLIVIVIGTASAVALKLLGVRYSVFLGTLMGAMTLVPAVGFLFALVITALVAFVTGHSVSSVLLISAVLVGLNLVDNYVLTPKLVGNRLNINALTTFVGLFGGGLLWGVWGMLLSVPALAVLRIALSAVPSLQAWGELLADKTERHLPIGRRARLTADSRPDVAA